jgi:hypothetical protein
MRTTVTIEPDLAYQLKRFMRQHDLGFKAALNQALRRGLASTVNGESEPPFAVDAKALDLRAGIDPARLNATADDLEIDAFRELAEQYSENRRS